MNYLFYYLGDSALPYRTIMAEHTDFSVKGIVIPKNKVVIAEQTHSKHVHVCHEKDSGAGFDEHAQIADCDAMVTNIQGQFLLIRTADCTPVLMYDEKTQSVGAIHSGREGTRKNIIGETVSTMQKQFNSLPENIKAWIGAGICKQHYQVSEIVWVAFSQSCKKQNILIAESDTFHLDIQDVIYQQLINAGLKPENISRNSTCTFESKEHFSFRREGTHNRQINIIGML